jgi:DNA-binding FadR family transcriptional regulator
MDMMNINSRVIIEAHEPFELELVKFSARHMTVEDDKKIQQAITASDNNSPKSDSTLAPLLVFFLLIY